MPDGFNERGRSLDVLTTEDDVLDAVNAMIAEGEEAAAPRVSEVQRNYKMFLGEHYLIEGSDGEWEIDDDNDDFRFRIKRDIIKQMVDALLPILMRGRPEYLVEADFPDQPALLDGRPIPNLTDRDLGRHWNTILEAMHEQRQEGITIAELLVDVLIAGIGLRTVMPDLRTGNVSMPVIGIEQLLRDPFGNRADFMDHKYVIIVTEMDAADIELKWGIKEDEFANTESLPTEGSGIFRRVSRFFRADNTLQTDRRFERRRYPIYDVYYNQATPELVSNLEIPSRALRFPRGRHLICINGKVIVVDEHNPFWHGQFPVVSYQAYPLPRGFYPRSDTDVLVNLQEGVNILYNMVIHNALMSANNQWIYEEDAMVEDEIISRPGAMIPVAQGALSRKAIQRLDPAPISRDVLAIAQELENYGRDDISGVTDSLIGNQPGPNASGVLANSLQAAAMSKQTFKMEMLDFAYRRQAVLEILTMQQFGRLANPKFSGRHQLGEYRLWSDSLRDLLFDVKVISKAELPHNVLARLQLGTQLLQLGVFDLIQFMDFTNLNVRPELRAKIDQAAKAFIPGVPLDIQHQAILAERQGSPPQAQGTPAAVSSNAFNLETAQMPQV